MTVMKFSVFLKKMYFLLKLPTLATCRPTLDLYGAITKTDSTRD